MYKNILTAYDKCAKKSKIPDGKTLEEISVCETALGCKFPDELIGLYREMNGDGCFICSLDELKWVNQRMRELSSCAFATREWLIVATSLSKYFYCYRIDTDTGKCQNGLYRYNRESKVFCPFVDTLNELLKLHYSNED